jgi:hypothetical protein
MNIVSNAFGEESVRVSHSFKVKARSPINPVVFPKWQTHREAGTQCHGSVITANSCCPADCQAAEGTYSAAWFYFKERRKEYLLSVGNGIIFIVRT